jgi:hypothetical protein
MIQIDSGTAILGTAPTGRPITARSTPLLNNWALIRRPDLRPAAAGGITIATVPPGLVRASACCAQASSDSMRGGSPYSHRGSAVSSS